MYSNVPKDIDPVKHPSLTKLFKDGYAWVTSDGEFWMGLDKKGEVVSLGDCYGLLSAEKRLRVS